MREYSPVYNNYEEERAARRAAMMRRRQAERNRRRILAAAIFATIMFVVFFFGTVKTKADSKEVYKYYTLVEVQAGDTLWDLAKDYIVGSDYTIQEYVKEIQELNHIQNGQIKAGEKLTMVYFSTDQK